ncbi:vascular cell adhesion protein 1 [Thamnophis elegans]|uniref:vascular cell adhesion protein 1 n=1 Tax=Thamnophis elegans TaxID=35005 RepID=UPI0013771AEE|nr:vascular cell adhesion protein 1 [Thamnophis elegans]
MAGVTSALLSLLLTFTTAKAFGIEDIVPDHRVVAQIGQKLALNCRTTGCESPYFSWRTQLDYPLGGTLSNQGKSSVLTLQSVGFQHEHQYLCTAGCKLGEPSKEKAVMVDIYSFPSDPVIELKSPLILGQPASVTCRVPKVYPSEQLKITLLKGKSKIKEKEFFQYPHTKSLQTKNLKMDFIPTEEDFEKEIVCVAELSLEDMTLEPRQSTHVMEINYGPRNTQIVAFPGNAILEGEALILTCLTESHPQASFVWKKQLPDGLTQNIMENYNLSIPNPQASDSGTYICEVTNEATSVVERTSLYISVQGSVFSTATSTLTIPSETTALNTPSETTALNTPSETTALNTPSETTALNTPSETTALNTPIETTALNTPSETTALNTPSETTALNTPSETTVFTTTTSFTSDAASETISTTSRATLKALVSITSEIRAPELISTSTSDTAPKIMTSVTSQAALKNNTVLYLEDVSDDDRNNTEEILIIARVEELDYVTPVIVVVSCLATVAGPAAAIFVYIFRKMKINGSYSLADSLKPNV